MGVLIWGPLSLIVTCNLYIEIELVELVPDFLSSDDELSSSLLHEAKSLCLQDKGNATIVNTQWLTLNGLSSYSYGGVAHEAKDLATYPSIHALLGKVNADTRTS